MARIYEEFEILAAQLEIKIIQGKGNFNGGYCTLENEPVIVLNENKPLEQRIKKLAEIFSKLDISNLSMKPIIREKIDAERTTTLF